MRLISGRRGVSLAMIIVAAAVLAGSAFAATVAAPSISSFSPTSVKTGAKITIAGKNLTGATSVMLGSMKATFKVVSSKAITVTVPAKAKTGALTVTTKGGKAKSKTNLTVS
jgi:IPT/TIG domain